MDDAMDFMSDEHKRLEIIQNIKTHIDSNKTYSKKVILCTNDDDTSNETNEKSKPTPISKPKLSPIITTDDPNFNELNPPSLQTYDSQAISIVDTIEDGIIRELERSGDLNRLIEGETIVFNELKNKISGSWTQRFVLKRAKIKYLNMLFNQRVSLLNTYTLRDQANTKKYLTAYHGLAVYTFYHESALKQIFEITDQYDKFVHFMQNVAVSFIQKAITLNQAQIVIDPLFLHAIAKIFALDIDDRHRDNERNESLTELHEVVHKMRSKLYFDLKRIEHSMQGSQQLIQQRIQQMRAVIGSTNQNPLVKDHIFNFVAVSREMKRNYKKLMIPKIFLNKMIIEYIPLFVKLTKFVSDQLIKVIAEWMAQSFDSFEFNAEIWNELKEKYKTEIAENVEIDLNEHYFVWIGENYAQTDVFLNNELIALDKLLKDHVVTQDVVHVVSAQPSCVAVPDGLRHLFDERREVLVGDGLMDAMIKRWMS